jgi:uncharacterized protein (DUF697 family)
MGLELSADRQEYAVNQIKKLCEDLKRTAKSKSDLIHAMWYCVHGNGARFEPYEEAFINEVSKEMPVIIVLTQSIIKNMATSLKSEIEKKNCNAKNIIIVRAQPYTDDDGKVLPEFGVSDLVEYTYSILPKEVQKEWANAQKASLKIKQDRARTLVLATAGASFGEGYIPLPCSDCAALIPTQVGMIAGITAIYGLNLSKSLLTGIVSSLVGTAGTTLAGKTIAANLLKMIPGVGTVVGGTISGATAATLTTALGESYIQVMNMVYKGELTEQDLKKDVVVQELADILKSKLKKTE